MSVSLCVHLVIRGVLWHTVLRIDDDGVLEEDILDGIVTPAADRANGEPVTAVAHAVSEGYILRAIVRAQTPLILYDLDRC